MRLVVNTLNHTQDLPVLLHIDGTVIVIVVLTVIVRLITSIVVR